MRIVIQGAPIAKARPRLTTRGRFPVVYDSQAKQFKAVQAQLIEKLKEIDFKSPLSSQLLISFSFHLPLALKAPEAKRNARLWGLDGSHKPDLDNLIKSWDFANGILWLDDAQIVEIHAEKKYSLSPCTIIEISAIHNPMDDKSTLITSLFSPDQLDDFACDVHLLSNALTLFMNAEKSEQHYYLPLAAKELSKFANDYLHKFAKLVKKGKS